MRFGMMLLAGGLAAATVSTAGAAEPPIKLTAIRALMEASQADAISDSCAEGILKGTAAREQDPAKFDAVSYAMDGVRYGYNQTRPLGDKILAGGLEETDFSYLKLFFDAPNTKRAMPILAPALADLCFTAMSKAFSSPMDKGEEMKAAVAALKAELKSTDLKKLKGTGLSDEQRAYVFDNLASTTTQKFMQLLGIEVKLRLAMAGLQDPLPAGASAPTH